MERSQEEGKHAKTQKLNRTGCLQGTEKGSIHLDVEEPRKSCSGPGYASFGIPCKSGKRVRIYSHGDWKLVSVSVFFASLSTELSVFLLQI